MCIAPLLCAITRCPAIQNCTRDRNNLVVRGPGRPAGPRSPYSILLAINFGSSGTARGVSRRTGDGRTAQCRWLSYLHFALLRLTWSGTRRSFSCLRSPTPEVLTRFSGCRDQDIGSAGRRVKEERNRVAAEDFSKRTGIERRSTLERDRILSRSTVERETSFRLLKAMTKVQQQNCVTCGIWRGVVLLRIRDCHRRKRNPSTTVFLLHKSLFFSFFFVCLFLLLTS